MCVCVTRWHCQHCQCIPHLREFLPQPIKVFCEVLHAVDEPTCRHHAHQYTPIFSLTETSFLWTSQWYAGSIMGTGGWPAVVSTKDTKLYSGTRIHKRYQVVQRYPQKIPSCTAVSTKATQQLGILFKSLELWLKRWYRLKIKASFCC